jgi:trk system potassium uptake protein TrkH
MNIGGMQLFKISSQDTAEKILPKSKEISVRLVFIYSSLTLICAVFYKIFGMNYFDSLTHSMTTIATGGFSNYNDSIGHFNSTLIEMNAVIFIILGSIPFISYIKYLNGDKSIFYKDAQISFFIKTIIVSIIIIYIFLFFKNYESETFLIRQVIFNVVSILTGTGYVTTNYSEWGNFSLIFFIVLMFIGGCAGSTACGLKIFRIHILYKFFVMQLKKYIYPRGIFVLKYSDNVLNEKFISSIISFVFLYIIIFFVITTLLSISGLDFVTAVSGAATSISNVGPGLGNLIGPNGNFSLLPDFSKWVLSAGMILGRLELFAIIVLFIPSFWRRY